MNQTNTNKEVGEIVGVPTHAVSVIAKYVLYVPRIGRDYHWTRKYIKRFNEILQIGKGKKVEL